MGHLNKFLMIMKSTTSQAKIISSNLMPQCQGFISLIYSEIKLQTHVIENEAMVIAACQYKGSERLGRTSNRAPTYRLASTIYIHSSSSLFRSSGPGALNMMQNLNLKAISHGSLSLGCLREDKRTKLVCLYRFMV